MRIAAQAFMKAVFEERYRRAALEREANQALAQRRADPTGGARLPSSVGGSCGGEGPWPGRTDATAREETPSA